MKQLLTAILIFIFTNLSAQTRFFSKVKVEYEREISVQALYKEMDGEWYERIKDRLPKKDVAYYNLLTDGTKSLYAPGREVPPEKPGSFYRPIADKNVVYTDFAAGTYIAQKPVYEETFLVQDSLLKINWEITPDTRTIAGYECRKAIGIIDDSIAVFAFYTDELLASGGPEGLHGLPGLILGVGIPRLHATWFATTVEVYNVSTSAIVPATKGKKVTRSSMLQSINKILSQWGEYGGKLIVNFAI